MNTYTVEPFSGKNYRDNSSTSVEGQDPCAICGKGVKRPWLFSVCVVDGGSNWARTEAEAADDSDPGHMGWWPVGPDCHRKYLVRSKV